MRAHKLLGLLVLCLLPLFGTGSCAGTECERNSDCAFAQCIGGECKAQCKLDLDCPLGTVCNRELGRCDPPDAGGVDAGASGGSGGSGGGGDASLGGFGGTAGGSGGTSATGGTSA
ncbi:MAG TPA: hypothetical protein PKD61_31240, partial [Polyangiaceae bacterium]|nr:hypothetical protein [Polyangiaceae bacterium]